MQAGIVWHEEEVEDAMQQDMDGETTSMLPGYGSFPTTETIGSAARGIVFPSKAGRPLPATKAVSALEPLFVPKKRGRPPKSSPELELDYRPTTSKYFGSSTADTFPPNTGGCAPDATGEIKGDDVFIGAYLLSEMRNKTVPTCVNCKTIKTPLWRKGWRDSILKRDVLLCNACGLKYSKRQYCCYCKFIYNMKEDVLSQQSNWMDCDSCRRWVHIDCELRYGTTFTFDGKRYQGPAQYYCPDCVVEQEQRRHQQRQQQQQQLQHVQQHQQQQQYQQHLQPHPLVHIQPQQYGHQPPSSVMNTFSIQAYNHTAFQLYNPSSPFPLPFTGPGGHQPPPSFPILPPPFPSSGSFPPRSVPSSPLPPLPISATFPPFLVPLATNRSDRVSV